MIKETHIWLVCGFCLNLHCHGMSAVILFCAISGAEWKEFWRKSDSVALDREGEVIGTVCAIAEGPFSYSMGWMCLLLKKFSH